MLVGSDWDEVTVHITLKPILLVASGDGSLTRVSGVSDQRFGGLHVDLLAIGRQDQPAVFLQPGDVARLPSDLRSEGAF